MRLPCIEAEGCLSERLLVRALAPAPEGAPEGLPIAGKARAKNGRDCAVSGCAKAWLARQRQAEASGGMAELALQMIAVHGMQRGKIERLQANLAGSRGAFDQAASGFGAGDRDVHAGRFAMYRLAVLHHPAVGAGHIGQLADGIRADLTAELDVIGPGDVGVVPDGVIT